MKFNLSFRNIAFIAWFILFAGTSCNSSSDTARVLVFSKTAAYQHASIPRANEAIMQLGDAHGFGVDTTTDARYFTDDSLKQYAAVVFLSTSGNVLDHYQEAAFERYIQSGGGFVGIHAATDTEYDWGWYGRLVGAYFEDHPAIQEARLQVVDASRPSTQHLPAQWISTDEWYNFKNLNKDVNVLITIDESSYEGGRNKEEHPMAWYHEYDGGRAFYTALGHTEEAYADSLYLQHLLGGIQYAIGNNERDYSRVRTPNVPDEDRFVKTVLTQGTLYEPTEMAILPNLDVLIAQRRGEIMLYKESKGTLQQAGYLDVYHQTGVAGVNAEEGVLGIAADPDFERNNFVYIFYSPADTSVNRLSRFELQGDSLLSTSEKVVLEFYSQRNICCHTGGSIAFGPDGLLYVSTGDNSTPFNEPGGDYVNNGYAPLDDRPGHEQYDARRTSANTNDLRGKIIRIRLKDDGSYEIPEGNLFSPNTPNARPEIYTMGHRNPYRISVDQKNSTLYWGEVGPDASNDSLETRGPRGYDEIGQARKAGNFGWPLFVGDNYTYRRYDYGTGRSGEAFDPDAPVNDSRNNTGLRELPAAEPAFIWYPYAASPHFPQVGTGGRNAMAGPVYYADLQPGENRYPAYYDGKLFIYEWIRNWIKVVTLRDGDFDKMEPFMPTTALSGPIDMEIGPDGKIYILEYGKGWFSKNEDSGLSRIDYLPGNRPPKVTELSVDRMNGRLPFTLTASVEATDPENDRLTYIWSMGSTQKTTREPELRHTFVRPGDHSISVKVVDGEGAGANSQEITVYAGNEAPQVEIGLQGNRSFFFEGVPVNYNVKVSDEGNEVRADNLYISADYIQGRDLAGASRGHQILSEAMVGKNLMQASDCSSCHKIDEKSIGPAFVAVAQRYQAHRGAVAYLSGKIIKGSSGVWGENAMPAHQTMDEGDADRIAKWVMSLAGEEQQKASLPASGRIMPDAAAAQKEEAVLRISATYTNEGGEDIRPLSGHDAIYLRSNRLDVTDFQVPGMATVDTLGTQYIQLPTSEGRIMAEQLDLRGIRAIMLEGVSNKAGGEYEVEVRSGGANGENIGKAVLKATGQQQRLEIPLQPKSTDQLQDVYIIFKRTAPGSKVLLKTVRFVPAVS